jgi:hypothetical protein
VPPRYRGGAYPDPERAVHGGDPRIEAKAAEPLDLGILVDHLRAALDQDAPPGPGPQIVVISFERDVILAFGC